MLPNESCNRGRAFLFCHNQVARFSFTHSLTDSLSPHPIEKTARPFYQDVSKCWFDKANNWIALYSHTHGQLQTPQMSGYSYYTFFQVHLECTWRTCIIGALSMQARQYKLEGKWTSAQRLLSLSDYKIYITQMPSWLVHTCANYNTGTMITPYRNVTMLSDDLCERWMAKSVGVITIFE